VTAPDPASIPLRILVVDSDERTRDSLCGLLSIGGRCVVVGSASRTDQALALVVSTKPDVVIVDPRVAGVGEADAFTARVRALAPETRIVCMGASDAGDGTSLPAGVDAWIRKTFRPRELLDAVVAAGRTSQN